MEKLVHKMDGDNAKVNGPCYEIKPRGELVTYEEAIELIQDMRATYGADMETREEHMTMSWCGPVFHVTRTE